MPAAGQAYTPRGLHRKCLANRNQNERHGGPLLKTELLAAITATFDRLMADLCSEGTGP